MQGEKSLPRGTLLYVCADIAVVKFRHGPAIPANEEMPGMRDVRIGAADERVQGVKPVHQVCFDQKFQRPINGGWCGFLPILIEPVKNVVSANRLMAAPDQSEYPLPLSRKSQAALLANSLRILHGLFDTTIMIVFAGRRKSDWQHFCHCSIRRYRTGIVPRNHLPVLAAAAWLRHSILYNSARRVHPQ